LELILWRHAEAEDGVPDASRKLTEKGMKQAQSMAQWLKPRLPKHTRIIVSPAKRTQQTAAALSDIYETVEAVGTSTTADKLLTVVNWPYEEGSVLVVGHQPTLGQIAASILGNHHTGLSVRKGSIWWFSSKSKNVSSSGSLRLVMIPDML
jgi:phosphohistidine phosphatase